MSVDGAELLHVFLDVSTVRYAISFSGWLQFFSGWIGIETKVMPIKTRSNFQGRTHLTHQLTLIMNLVSIYRKADSLDLKKNMSNVYLSWNVGADSGYKNFQYSKVEENRRKLQMKCKKTLNQLQTASEAEKITHTLTYLNLYHPSTSRSLLCFILSDCEKINIFRIKMRRIKRWKS